MSIGTTPRSSAAPRNLWQGLGAGVPKAILMAAVDLFAERGYHATSTRHISTGAGLSPAAMYVHYRSKEEVLFEITRRGHEVVLDMASAAARDERPAVEVLSGFIYVYTRWHAEHHKAARVAQFERNGLDTEHAAVINHMRRRISEIVRDLINRGAADGAFNVPDPRGAALAILSLGIDVARWFQPSGQYTPHYVGTLYLDLTLRMLGAPIPATAPDPGR